LYTMCVAAVKLTWTAANPWTLTPLSPSYEAFIKVIFLLVAVCVDCGLTTIALVADFQYLMGARSSLDVASFALRVFLSILLLLTLLLLSIQTRSILEPGLRLRVLWCQCITGSTIEKSAHAINGKEAITVLDFDRYRSSYESCVQSVGRLYHGGGYLLTRDEFNQWWEYLNTIWQSSAIARLHQQ
jgi:hypothetical protein